MSRISTSEKQWQKWGWIPSIYVNSYQTLNQCCMSTCYMLPSVWLWALDGLRFNNNQYLMKDKDQKLGLKIPQMHSVWTSAKLGITRPTKTFLCATWRRKERLFTHVMRAHTHTQCSRYMSSKLLTLSLKKNHFLGKHIYSHGWWFQNLSFQSCLAPPASESHIQLPVRHAWLFYTSRHFKCTVLNQISFESPWSWQCFFLL